MISVYSWHWTKLTKRWPMGPYLVPSIASVCCPLLFGHWINYAHIYTNLHKQWLIVFALLLWLCDWERRSTHLLTDQMKFHVVRDCGESISAFRRSMEVHARTTNRYARVIFSRWFLSSTDRWRFDAQNAASFSIRLLLVKHSFRWHDNFRSHFERAHVKLRMAGHCVAFYHWFFTHIILANDRQYLENE